MRIRFIIGAFCIIAAIVTIPGFFNSAKSNVTGAAAGNTGSPADGQDCTSCHTPNRDFSGSGLISSNIPVSGYTANQTYTLTASITRLGHTVFGFEVSPQDTTSAGNLLGTIIITNTTKTQLASGIQGYITHKQAGTTGTGGSISWSFNWTAPATGHGPVVFYGAFNASNDNGHDTGDSIFLTSLKVYECVAPVAPGAITGAASVCSGAVSTYTVPAAAAGTTFTWTLPSGWTGSSTTNSITATAGANGGNILVTAVNSCGTSGAASKTITVTNSVTAGVSISPSQNDICAGAQVIFTAIPANGGTSPVYQWRVNGAVVGANASNYSSSAFNNGDVVSCALTSSLACVLNNPAISDNVTMLVNPNVTPSVSISASDLTICADSTVTFTAASLNGGSSPAYQWYKNASVVSGAVAPTFTPSAVANNDVFTVQLTSDASCVSPAVVTSNADTVHITQLVTPSVTISSNQGSSVCKNQSVTFSSSLANEGNTPSFQWQKNGVNINGAINSGYTSDSLNNGDIISLHITSSVACASPQSVQSNTITMQVSSVTPAVSITSNSGSSICAQQPVIFTSVISGGGSNPQYQWKKNGLNINNATGASYSSDSLLNGDVISLQLTSNAACASPQSVPSNSITITVVTNAVPSVTISSAFGDSICSGLSGTLSAIQLNGGNSPAYQWFKNGDSITGAYNQIYTPSAINNNDSFSVELTSNSSCVTAPTAFSGALIITVIPTVVPAVTVTLEGSDSICAGQNVTFIAAVQNAGSSPSLQWLDNGVNINNQSGYSFSSSTLNDSSLISVMLSTTLTCATPSTLLSASILIRVSQPVHPIISFVSSAGDTVCAGQTLTFSATQTGGGPSPLFQWFRNDTLLATDTSSTLFVPVVNNQDAYTVQLISDATCAVPSAVTSAIDTLTVPPAVQSSVMISATGDSVCSGATVIFNASIQSFGGSYSSPSFYWEKNGAVTGNNTSTYDDTSVTNGEVIFCHCASSSVCQAPIASNSITMTVFAATNPIITQNNDTLQSSAAASYQWYYNGTQINGATAQILPTDSAGVYTVTTIDKNGCPGAATNFNFVPSGLNDLYDVQALTLYPNPTDGLLNIELTEKIAGYNLRLLVYNIRGEILHQQLVSLSSSQANIQLDLNALPNGIYVLQINSAQINAYRKFVIAR